MLIHPLPDPIAITIGPLSIHWYGLMYVAAFLQFIVLGRLRLKHPGIADKNWKLSDLDDILFYGVLGVIIGGRLGEVVFYNPAYFAANPIEILFIWQGGMSFHGGFLGVIVAMWLWGRKHGRHPIDTLDFIAPMVPLGYAFGRIGNFINAELHGRIADPALPWAMIWPNVDSLPRHPSPLYQALVDGLLFFILLWLFSRKARPRWAISGMFLLLYGCARFFTEYFRTPDYEVSIASFTISAGQMLSLPMVAASVIFFWLAYREPEKAGAERNIAEPPRNRQMASEFRTRSVQWVLNHSLVSMIFGVAISLLMSYWIYDIFH